jgi:ring-1,2-phenylacetyl-CoA epoxidase subunit PaaC
MSESLIALVTALADDELIIGHRHSEWTGFAPHIEEDVAFSSIAQDEIGHAAALYAIVASLTDDDADRLALGRPKDEFRHAVICERPNREWSYTLARHWLYDHADEIRLEALEGSAHKELAALATKVRREERWHLLHADTWLRRIARGPVEGRTKLEDAMVAALPDAVGLFDPFELEDEAVKEGWLPMPSEEQRRRFSDRVSTALDELGLPTEMAGRLDESAEFVASSSGDLIASDDATAGGTGETTTGTGGRSGRHTQDFDELWDVMTKTYRAHPGATW